MVGSFVEPFSEFIIHIDDQTVEMEVHSITKTGELSSLPDKPYCTPLKDTVNNNEHLYQGAKHTT